ncbi:MAG: magnesium transporter, partial [Clostridia bacterium]|nr:magnesium transporter [Clostridia bacterium]
MDTEEITSLEEQLEEKFDTFFDLLHNKRYSELKKELSELYEQDIAEFLETIDEIDDVVKTFRLLPKDIAADVFAYVDSDLQEEIVRKLSDTEVHNIIEDLSVDDATDFLEELPANVVKHILENSSATTRQTINKLLQYEEDTAGSIMTTEYIDLKSGMTVQEALDRIRKLANDTEQLNTFYVTDRRKLKGVISIRDLLTASPQEKVENLMEENIIYGETVTDQETLANLFKKYDVLTMPILDKDGRLVGIVTVDDIIDIINEEATEDIAKMAAIVPTEKPYLKTGVFRIWLSRIPWLLLLMVSATFTGLILNTYQEKYLTTLLIACVPMLMDTGGNAGGQASVTVIRGIALNEINFKDFFKVVWKELRVGIICAVSLGAVCFLKLQLIDTLLLGYGYDVLTSLVVSLSMAITIIVAKFVGCMLPLLAKAVKLD